ncbi:response regulator [Aliterella atlantica]|uniref:Response regulator receiver protein n=1 Tax=Aliterella atlantica CENA595 TaxID=1618023 RepID=A0A0D8ZTS1_9CYAN|nr:response regulator [Aliterella atlantica]KJH71762.1 response regulator receiver protein [Aliterella atlantica CENA595]
MSLSNSSNRSELENREQPLILAVDDNDDNLQLLSQLLVLMECSFITATDGVTALDLAQKHLPKLILLDMMLPDLSGIEVANRLKQNAQTASIPIIAVTAMARAEDKESFIVAGCIDYITKPYIIDDLEMTIRRYVGE